MSSWSAWRWVTSAMRPPSATAALSAATLLSRPTWSGTIISGKITVSRSATRGSSVIMIVCSSSGLDARFGIGSPTGFAVLWLGGRNGRGLYCWFWGRCCLWFGCRVARLFRRGSGRGFAVEALEDPRAEALLELEQDSHAGEVDAQVLGQVADPQDSTDVVL